MTEPADSSTRRFAPTRGGACVHLDRATTPPSEPPIAPRRPHVLAIHGEELDDPYHWLRERDDPAVLEYLEAENAYTAARTAHTRALRERLYAELRAHVPERKESVPHRRGGHVYYRRFAPGREHPAHYRRRLPRGAGPPGDEELLLDLDRMARGHSFLRLGALAPDPSGRLVAYTVDTSGRERFRLRVLDPATGEPLDTEVTDVAAEIAWASDRIFFYVRLDHAERPFEVRRHTLGTDPNHDPVVFCEEDARFVVAVARSRSGEVIRIASRSKRSSETRFVPCDDPGAEPTLFLPRRDDVRYSVEHHPDGFFLRTDDGARGFRLYRVPGAGPGPGLRPADRPAWQEILPPRRGIEIEEVAAFRRHLVVTERVRGRRRLRVLRLADGGHHVVRIPESVYAIEAAENHDFDADGYRFAFTSPLTPVSVYEHRFEDRTLRLLQRERVPRYHPERYEATQIEARADDGAAIPITLVHARGLPRDGRRPCLLYAYGSYGTTIDPSFSVHHLPLLERGFVCAIAHVRGGGYFGHAWHESGKLEVKRNTFSDFIRAAEELFARGYTASDRLAIAGGSAGGLLIGAVLNQRPDLAAAAIAQVPFVDVLNTMLDHSLPLTVTELEEWGDPLDPAQFAYMRGYSPYDNVRPQAYPHLLVTAGLEDPRVQYWEPAKWVARLRAAKTDDNMLLLLTHMDSGHFGASGRYQALHETAFEHAFVLDALGLS